MRRYPDLGEYVCIDNTLFFSPRLKLLSLENIQQILSEEFHGIAPKRLVFSIDQRTGELTIRKQSKKQTTGNIQYKKVKASSLEIEYEPEYLAPPFGD